MSMEKTPGASQPNQSGSQKTNRPPWWVGYALTLIIGFAVWIKSLVSSGHEEAVQARNDLKEQLREANERQDRLIITLQHSNIMTANLLAVIRELNHIQPNESYYLDSLSPGSSGKRNDNNRASKDRATTN